MNPYLAKAVRWHQAGKLDKAEKAYRSLLKENPRDAETLNFMGILAHQRGHSDTAAGLLALSLETNPLYVDAMKNLGRVLRESGRVEEAVTHYRTAAELAPADPAIHNALCITCRHLDRLDEAVEAGYKAVSLAQDSKAAWLSLGMALMEQGSLQDAVLAFYSVLNIDPRLVVAYVSLAQCLKTMEAVSDTPEDVVKAQVETFEKWLENDPDNEIALYMLSAIRGDGRYERSPDNYIRDLFDSHADAFNEHLDKLDYRGPSLVERWLVEHCPNPEGQWRVLDAGCGTGLISHLLKPYARALVGIDLSGGMLQQAANTGDYDRLEQAELGAWLDQEAKRYDLIVCADTLCYFGPLESVLAGMARCMNPGAKFMCTVQELLADSDKDHRLGGSGRYDHREEYLRRCLESAGLDRVEVRRDTLRREAGQPVEGMVVSARKPGLD